jgi:hypothetical protein
MSTETAARLAWIAYLEDYWRTRMRIAVRLSFLHLLEERKAKL